jgi:hypothetical protein
MNAGQQSKIKIEIGKRFFKERQGTIKRNMKSVGRKPVKYVVGRRENG